MMQAEQRRVLHLHHRHIEKRFVRQWQADGDIIQLRMPEPAGGERLDGEAQAELSFDLLDDDAARQIGPEHDLNDQGDEQQ